MVSQGFTISDQAWGSAVRAAGPELGGRDIGCIRIGLLHAFDTLLVRDQRSG